MNVRITTSGEITKMIRQARSDSAVKGWKIRRVRQWLQNLYALEDPRMLEARIPDNPVGFLERLFALEDPRG